MTLFRLLCPETIVIEARGTFKSSVKKSTQASFARPSTGGAVKATLSASPNCPTTAFRLARGWSFNRNVTPAAVSLTAIMPNHKRRCVSS
jgi:hypothetical protein